MATPPASAFPQTASWNANLFGGPGVTVGSDILYVALRLIRVIRPGHGPQSEILTEALAALNAMIDAWNTERLIIPAVLRQVFDITAGSQSYTIGPSGSFLTTARPSRVEKAGLIDVNGGSAQPAEIPLEVLTLEQWKDIEIKNLTSSIPSKLWYDQGLDVGNGMVYLWPIPSVNNQIALYLWQTLLQFQAIEDPFAMYPGYLRAIQYNLAVELFPRLGIAVMTQIVMDTAMKAKAAIKTLNNQVPVLRCDPALVASGHGADWRTG